MLEQPVGMADARIMWDQLTDRWLVRRQARAWLVRRWNWGERRRLLAWAAPEGALDAERFVVGLLDLLVCAQADGAPVVRDAEERDWVASVTLELLGVLPGCAGASIADAELSAAQLLGWGPFELDRQLLPATDELLARLGERAAPAPQSPEDLDESWTRIVVDDG